jgi:hypothetical protein
MPSILSGRTMYDDLENQFSDDVDFDDWDYASTGHHVSWTAIGLVIVVIITLAVGAKWLYNRKANLLFMLGKAKKNFTKGPKKAPRQAINKLPDIEAPGLENQEPK